MLRPTSVTAPPTRVRFGVPHFAIALAIISYIDRVCISWSMPNIRATFGLVGAAHDDAVGWIFSAFTFAYALFEMPTGWLGDRFGPRKTLVRVVLWWSLFTAATGWTWSFGSLIAVRFLFGIGEAGCFPNLTRAFSIWLRPEEKVRGQSILWLGARWGGAFTPLLVAGVLAVVSWRVSFSIFSSLGILWAFFFYRWFRDDPGEHPAVNEAERALLAGNPPVARHGTVPWTRFLSSRTTWWLLWAQYFFFSYCWYFYITWLPQFLKDSYGVAHGMVFLAMLAGIPLLGGGFGNLVAGRVVPGLAARLGDVRSARRVLPLTGCALAGLMFVFLAQHLNQPVVVMGAMGLASFFGDLTMPSAWGACMDVGGTFSGTYSGSMNMMGNLGGAVGPIVVGYLLKTTGQNWGLIYDVSAGALFLAAVCWIFIDPVTSLAPIEAARVEPSRGAVMV
jgi:MFS family permease